MSDCIQLDLVDYIAGLPPMKAPTLARGSTARFAGT